MSEGSASVGVADYVYVVVFEYVTDCEGLDLCFGDESAAWSVVCGSGSYLVGADGLCCAAAY